MQDQSKFTISNFDKKKWNDYLSEDGVSEDCRYSRLTSMYSVLFGLVSKMDEPSSTESKNVSRKKKKKAQTLTETKFPEGFVSMMRYMSESKPKELIPRPLKIISKKDLLAARAKCLTEKNTPMQLQIVDVENRNKISNKQSIDSETKIQDFPKTKTDSDKQAPSHFNKSLLTTSCETLELLKLSDRYTKTIGSTRFNDSHKNTLKPTVEGSSARKRVDKGQDKLNWCSTDIKEKPLKKSVLRYRLRQIAIEKSSVWYQEYISIVEPSERRAEDPTTPRHNINSTCGQFYDSLHGWRHSVRYRVEKLKSEKNEDTN